MASVTYEHVVKQFKGRGKGGVVTAVNDLSLEIIDKEFLVLVGPSGCGKTTALRLLAGLEEISGGNIMIGDRVVNDVAPKDRDIAMVFQSYALYPHMSVYDNMAFGLKLRKTPKSEIDMRVKEAADILQIGHLLQRKPKELSGGQRQRVALARAVAIRPGILLLDEPLTALDLKRKNEILPYLERLHDELDIPMLLVSHSPDEVVRLADHVVLLDHGRVVAQGSLQETLARLDLPTAFGEDAGVVIESRVAEHDDRYHLTRLEFPGGAVLVARRPEPLGQRLRFRVQARDVSLALTRSEDSTITNVLPVMVGEVAEADTPAHVLVRLNAEGTPLLARITRRSCDQLGIVPGRRLWAQIKAVALLA